MVYTEYIQAAMAIRSPTLGDVLSRMEAAGWTLEAAYKTCWGPSAYTAAEVQQMCSIKGDEQPPTLLFHTTLGCSSLGVYIIFCNGTYKPFMFSAVYAPDPAYGIVGAKMMVGGSMRDDGTYEKGHIDISPIVHGAVGKEVFSCPLHRCSSFRAKVLEALPGTTPECAFFFDMVRNDFAAYAP